MVKEAKRSPLKAAALLALAVVASYLWGGRLVRPLTVATESDPSPTAMSSTATQAGFLDSGTARGIGQAAPKSEGDPVLNATANIGASKPVWVQFQEWLSRQKNNDEESAAFRRDPFQPPVMPPPETEPNEGSGRLSDNGEDETARPEDLGLELRAVIIGPQGNLAVLGEEVVEEGSQIVVSQKGRTIPVRIAKITGEHASIEIGEKEYELRLPPVASIPSH